MNRSVNILLLAISFPAMFLVLYYGFGLPIFRLETETMEHQLMEYVFMGFASLIFIIAVRRAIHRWVGVGMMRKPERFYWSVPIGAERKKQVKLFFVLEAVIALGLAIACHVITPQAWPMKWVYFSIFVEQMIFIFVAGNWFRIGISDKALVVADREVNVLYFSGLRRVELHQQTVYFEYLEELQLFFPVNAVEKADFEAFRTALEEKVNKEKVFFSEKFKNY